MDPENAKIEGDLTIVQGPQGNGTLYTDKIKESTTNTGINLLSKTKVIESLTIDNTAVFTGTGLTATSYNFFSGNKGIEVSPGNVRITTDSYTGFTIEGGTEILKTLDVAEGITGSSKTHELTGTDDNEVLKIKNTSSLGSSTVTFSNEFSSKKMEMGYSNVDSVSIIKTEGSALLFKTNFIDTVKFKTDGSIEVYNTTASTSSSTGALTLQGGLGISSSSDATSVTNGGSITTGGGAAIAKSLFVGGNLITGGYVDITPVVQPSPPLNHERLYFDTKLKSINSSGGITVYQPTVSKGDLSSHDGVSQVRLPVGIDGQMLTVDNSTDTGLIWKTANYEVTEQKGDLSGHNGVVPVRVPAGTDGYVLSSNSNTTNGLEWVPVNRNLVSIFSLNNTVPCIFIQNPSGSFYNFVYPHARGGPSSLFFHSKSSPEIDGNTTRLCSNPSALNCKLSGTWEPYEGIQISKTLSDSGGSYATYTSSGLSMKKVVIDGSVTVFSETRGIKVFSVTPNDEGPCATFVCIKRETNTTGIVSRINSSPYMGTNLSAVWNSAGIVISGTSGEYIVTDFFQEETNNITVTLTQGVPYKLPKSFFNFYENKSFMVGIESIFAGGPCCVFAVSKNNHLTNGNVASFGVGIAFAWPSDSLPNVTASVSGTYKLFFTPI